MFRVSTFGTHELSVFNAMQTQKRLQDGQIAGVTGFKSQDYAGFNVDTRRLLSMESTVARIDSYQRNIETTERRLKAMETNVAQLHDIASEANKLLVNALNANDGEDLQLHVRAEKMLEQVAGLLNLKHEERYLFAGARTDIEPVDLTAYDPTDLAYNPADPTTANAGYYNGDTAVLSGRVDESMTLEYGITAAEGSFENLIRGLQLAVNGGVPGSLDRATLEQSLDLIDDAVRDIPDVRGRIGANLSSLEAVKDKHAQLKLYAEETIVDTEQADVAATATQVAADQVLLETSYTLTSRLSQLSLANFLR